MRLLDTVVPVLRLRQAQLCLAGVVHSFLFLPIKSNHFTTKNKKRSFRKSSSYSSTFITFLIVFDPTG